MSAHTYIPAHGYELSNVHDYVEKNHDVYHEIQEQRDVVVERDQTHTNGSELRRRSYLVYMHAYACVCIHGACARDFVCARALLHEYVWCK